jgi:hypothetical protein
MQTLVHATYERGGQHTVLLELTKVCKLMAEGRRAIRETSLGDAGVLVVMEKDKPLPKREIKVV